MINKARKSFFVLIASIFLTHACMPMEEPIPPAPPQKAEQPKKPSPKKPKVKPPVPQLQEEAIHVPLIILFDQEGQETPEAEEGISGIFLNGIQSEAAPLLVSQAVLYNLIERYKNKKETSSFPKDFNFDSKNWKIFSSKEKGISLFLLFPAKLFETYGQYFNLGKLQEIKPASHDFYDKIDDFNPNKTKLSVFQAKHLESFLKSAKEDFPIWDIYIMGHGLAGKSICNLTPSVMQDVLTFFNDKIRTGILIVSSCYIGGTNLEFFKFKKDINNDDVLFALTYPVIALGTESSVTSKVSFDFRNIFSFAKDHDLSKLMLEIKNYDIHGESVADTLSKRRVNIPQIILPGGREIQSLTLDQKVEVVGNVKAKTAALNKKDIVIKDKEIVLLYPQNLIARLIITPAANIYKMLTASVINHMDNLFPLSDENIKRIEDYKTNYPILSKIDLKAKKQNARYPSIVSMIKGDVVHFIKSIKIKTPDNSYHGVLSGLLDLFSDVPFTGAKTFLIETVDGLNDVGIWFEHLRLLYLEPNAEPNDLELLLEHDKQNRFNKPITLKNAIIQVEGNLAGADDKGIFIERTFTLRFQFFNSDNTVTAWCFSIFPTEKQYSFQFSSINNNEYEKEANEMLDRITFRRGDKESGVDYGPFSLDTLIKTIEAQPTIIETEFLKILSEIQKALDSKDPNVQNNGKKLCETFFYSKPPQETLKLFKNNMQSGTLTKLLNEKPIIKNMYQNLEEIINPTKESINRLRLRVEKTEKLSNKESITIFLVIKKALESENKDINLEAQKLLINLLNNPQIQKYALKKLQEESPSTWWSVLEKLNEIKDDSIKRTVINGSIQKASYYLTLGEFYTAMGFIRPLLNKNLTTQEREGIVNVAIAAISNNHDDFKKQDLIKKYGLLLLNNLLNANFGAAEIIKGIQEKTNATLENIKKLKPMDFEYEQHIKTIDDLKKAFEPLKRKEQEGKLANVFKENPKIKEKYDMLEKTFSG